MPPVVAPRVCSALSAPSLRFSRSFLPPFARGRGSRSLHSYARPRVALGSAATGSKACACIPKVRFQRP